MSATAQVPPQALDAEESILGALMLMPYNSNTLDQIRETGLTPNDFYRESHARIYRTATQLQAEQIQPDAIALTARLEEQGHLDQVGGRARIHELAQTVPATANAPHYAKIVHEKAVWRGLITAGQNAARLGFEQVGEPGQALEHARAMLDQSTNGSGPASTVQVVTLAQFTAVTDDHVEPLIGTSDETLLPADGMLLMYGDGGAGKTSLSIDALAHVAAGADWLGQTIPSPARCLLIENEGPRGPFRRRLQQKVREWAGRPFVDNVHVLEEPWTRFTLTDPGYRRGLAKEIDRTQTQLVIVGPLASLGAKGTGTPDDVNEFSALIADLKAQAETQFAIWIVHHENKAGDVSGAWERVPDTLVHVSAQGNGRTRVAWRKVRWSSVLHNTSVNLLWADNTSFTLDEAHERDYRSELREKFEESNAWRTLTETRKLIKANQDKVHEALVQLVESDDFLFQIGPPGRSGTAKCWRLRTYSDPPSNPESPGLFEHPGEATYSVTPPIKELPEEVECPTPPASYSDSPSESAEDDQRGEWFT